MIKKSMLIISTLVVLLALNRLSAHPGIGIVMDSKGNVFYTDLMHVWKISPDGSHTIAVNDVHTHELYLDEDDNLYGEHSWYEGEATDKWGYYVWCLSSTGELERTIPPTEGFPLNNTLVRDSRGQMYWPEKSGDYEVLKKETTDGVIALHTDHKFKDIRWLYFSGHDNIVYVIDHLKLKKVSARGKVVVVSDKLKENGPAHAGVGDHHYLFGVWSDTQRHIYTAVYGARKVKKINPDGDVEILIESPKDWSPTGGLIAPDGSLWIMEFSVNHMTRIRRIDPDGKEVVFQKE